MLVPYGPAIEGVRAPQKVVGDPYYANDRGYRTGVDRVRSICTRLPKGESLVMFQTARWEEGGVENGAEATFIAAFYNGCCCCCYCCC